MSAVPGAARIQAPPIVQERPPSHLVGPGESGSEIVSRPSQIEVNGRVLKYTSRAGFLPIRENETGEIHGNMFFVAYTLDQTEGRTPRPLTFLWNGGPGSSSSLVHLLGFGPRRFRTGGVPVDNDGTWLDFTDLVFVDPIGTGYSRPTKAEYGPEFYQTRGDAESVAEFIRVYRNRFEAWEAPLFLAGESYGVTRAAGVADALQRRRITVAGAVLIGLALPLGRLSDEMRTALMVPTYTAAAFANRKLAPELQSDLQAALRQAERWVDAEYIPALKQRDTIDEAGRDRVLAGLSRFTGLKAGAFDRKTLSIGMPQFAEQLLRDENKVVGRYDSRLVGPLDTTQQLYDPTKDPSLKNIIDDVAVLRYLRNELGFQSDLLYQGPFGGGYPPPTAFRGDWMSVRWNRQPAGERAGGPGGAGTAPAGRGGAPTEEEQPLRRAMRTNPGLKVLVACGYFDLVCSYAGNDQLVRQLEPDLAGNVVSRGYAGGHAVYTDDAVRRALKADVARFMETAVAPRR
jgi:carboxypeptidase C (cathepsin A)